MTVTEKRYLKVISVDYLNKIRGINDKNMS